VLLPLFEIRSSGNQLLEYSTTASSYSAFCLLYSDHFFLTNSLISEIVRDHSELYLNCMGADAFGICYDSSQNLAKNPAK